MKTIKKKTKKRPREKKGKQKRKLFIPRRKGQWIETACCRMLGARDQDILGSRSIRQGKMTSVFASLEDLRFFPSRSSSYSYFYLYSCSYFSFFFSFPSLSFIFFFLLLLFFLSLFLLLLIFFLPLTVFILPQTHALTHSQKKKCKIR